MTWLAFAVGLLLGFLLFPMFTAAIYMWLGWRRG